MGSVAEKKPHAVCVPYPAQGHITPMLKLAKVLHSRGFHVTFVNSHYNHARLLRSRGPSALDSLPDFRFASIPDGLPPTQADDVTQDIPSLCDSTMKNCLAPFRDLLADLNHPSSGVPPVTCIVSDGVMSWTLDAAEELGLPEILFWTTSACGFMGYLHYKDLVHRGITPLKDMSDLDDKYLEREIDGIPGMEGIRFKDFPSFVRTTDPNDFMLNFAMNEAARASRASAIVLNTFEDLEGQVLEAMSTILPPVYAVGPLTLVSKQVDHACPTASSMGSNLWKEDPGCLEWLEGKPEASVVYVNFGSITVMTKEQFAEFAWGLANCGREFLWVIRPDLVRGDNAVLPEEFVEQTRGRGLLASWCPQEEVLRHPAVGGFLTHCGWNSILDAVCGGVPVACWPFFAEQQTNCRYSCAVWGFGIEVGSAARRGEVERMIRELMGGEGGKRMRKEALKWKDKAIAAVTSSIKNVDLLIELLQEY